MKTFSLLAALMVAACSISVAQPKVVHFKKLQEFLPAKDFEGFKRGKPTGNTSTAMGMTTSEAGVRFVKPPANDSALEQSIEIKINDMSLMPLAAWAMAFQQGDYENETEEGYEKSVTVKKNYKGIEKSQSGDYKSCSLNFSVGNRFSVNLEGSNFSDAAILHRLAENMDLEKLEKATAEK